MPLKSIYDIDYPLTGKSFSWLRQVLLIRKDFLGYLLNIGLEKDIVRLPLFPRTNTVMIIKPEYVAELLTKNHKLLVKSKYTHKFLEQSIGGGINVAEGEQHIQQRKLLIRSFTTGKLKLYTDMIVNVSKQKLINSKSAVELEEMATDLTFEIISILILGKDIPYRRDLKVSIVALSDLIVYKLEKFWLPDWLPTKKSRSIRKNIKYANDAVAKMIMDRRANRKDDGSILSDIIEFADLHDWYDDKLVQAECLSLFFAGHETSSQVLSWLFITLSKHPEAVDKIRDEIQTLIGSHDITYEDLKKFTYLNAVIHETLRLYPPAWIFDRQPIEDITIGGWLIPKGTHIWISPWVMHRDARNYPDPEKFKPERWIDSTLIPSFDGFLPFGMGNRSCLGQHFALFELQLILITVLRSYNIELKTQVEKIYPTARVTVTPNEQVKIIFSKRNHH